MKLRLLVVLALVVAACGGTATADDTEGVATLSGDTGTQSETETASDLDPEEAMIAFTECMRDQGVEMSDPVVDADGNVRPGRAVFDGDGGPDDASRDVMEAARSACSEYLDGVTLGFERFDDTEFQDQLLAFSECMREQGIEMGDPSFGTGDEGPRRGAGLFGEGFDPEDPEFQAALEACQEQMPGFGGGFGGGPGGGPGGGN